MDGLIVSRDSLMRKIIISLLFMLSISSLISSSPVKAAPKSEIVLSPAQIIALINAYRSEFGLPGYAQNAILMQTAQGQADYQASIETVTHEGPTGNRPRDRAYAAGYGSGEIVFISEIIYGGSSAGPETAVSWWKTSQIHNDTMLASTYQEIGAGVASANGRNYYTAVMGYEAGGVYVAPDVNSYSDDSGEEIVAAPIIIPVIEATPQNDGSITHIIRTGQTLWTLAAVYEVSLASILDLNSLPENAVVHPGDEILIISGDAPTSIPENEIASDELATETLVSNITVAPTTTSTNIAPVQIEEVNALPTDNSERVNANIRLTISLALVFIAIIVLATFFVKSPKSLTDQETRSVSDE